MFRIASELLDCDTAKSTLHCRMLVYVEQICVKQLFMVNVLDQWFSTFSKATQTENIKCVKFCDSLTTRIFFSNLRNVR